MIACPTPLPLATLTDYWVHDLAPAAEAAAEEHLMACAACAERAEALAGVVAAARDAIRRGEVPLALTPALLARLEHDGVRIRHHHVEAGSQTRCTAGPDDDLIALTLRGEFHAGERVDLVYLDAPESLRERRTDVPVDNERGEVVFAERGDAVRALPALRMRLGLYGIGPAGERTIGEYTLLHTPWPGATW